MSLQRCFITNGSGPQHSGSTIWLINHRGCGYHSAAAVIPRIALRQWANAGLMLDLRLTMRGPVRVRGCSPRLSAFGTTPPGGPVAWLGPWGLGRSGAAAARPAAPGRPAAGFAGARPIGPARRAATDQMLARASAVIGEAIRAGDRPLVSVGTARCCWAPWWLAGRSSAGWGCGLWMVTRTPGIHGPGRPGRRQTASLG